MKIVKVNKKTWNHIVDISKDAWFFERYELKEIVEKSFGYKSDYFGIKKDDIIVALFPIFYIKKFSIKYAESIPNHIASPVFLDEISDKKRKKIFTVVFDYLKKKKVCWYKCYYHPLSEISLNTCINPLVTYEFFDISSYVYILSLEKKEEELFMSLNKKFRNLVRKALKNDIKVEVFVGKEGFEYFYPMHVHTYKENGLDPYPEKYFDLASKLKEWMYFIAFKNKEPIAGIVVPMYKQGASYWMGASIKKVSGANNLLIWEAIRYAKKSGYKYFDSSEVFPNAENLKLKNIYKFKSGFGGKLRYFFKGVKVFNLKKWLFYNSLRVLKRKDLNALKI